MCDVTLAILAGGRGTRMGRPKATLTLHGRPILARLLDRFAWTGPTMLVLAPGIDRPTAADRFDAIVEDAVPDEGPLRGIFTALESATTPTTVITTVDMPGVTRELLEFVATELTKRASALAVMLRREELEPFPSAYRAAARDLIAHRLAERRRAVHALAAEPGVAVIPARAHWNPSVWANLNHPADVERFERDPGS